MRSGDPSDRQGRDPTVLVGGTYQVEGVLDRRLIVHRPEVVVLQREDDGLLQKLVAHEELLAGSRDVAVVVLDAHTSESGLLDLQGNCLGDGKADFDLLRRVDSGIRCRSEDVETFVSDFINHIY